MDGSSLLPALSLGRSSPACSASPCDLAFLLEAGLATAELHQRPLGAAFYSLALCVLGARSWVADTAGKRQKAARPSPRHSQPTLPQGCSTLPASPCPKRDAPRGWGGQRACGWDRQLREVMPEQLLPELINCSPSTFQSNVTFPFFSFFLFFCRP